MSLIFTVTLHAQPGRHTLPHDTMAIGGEQQEVKMNRMESKQALRESIASLRDSIDNKISFVTRAAEGKSAGTETRQNTGIAKTKSELNRYKKQLTTILEDLNDKRWTEAMSERAYETLNDVRRQFRRIEEEWPEEQ